MATLTSATTARVLNPTLAQKIMTATEAAALIRSADQIGMSGFTGSGYPKAVPLELAHRIAEAHLRGQKFQVSVFTGASTGPELDGAVAMAGGIHLRLLYPSHPETRKRINSGEMDYMDIHLSHVAQFVEYGFLGKLDVALIEVAAVLGWKKESSKADFLHRGDSGRHDSIAEVGQAHLRLGHGFLAEPGNADGSEREYGQLP